MNAIVLGTSANSDQENIGDAVAKHLEDLDMSVETSDCWDERTHQYDVPFNLNWKEANALVVSLGRTSMEPFTSVSESELRDVIRGCLTLPLEAARQYVDARMDRGGRLVFVGSYAHSHPFSTGTAYCAAKAGLAMAVRTMAWEIADLGFFPTIVHPYHVTGTPMWEKVQDGVMRNKGMTRDEADMYALKDAKMPLVKPHQIADIIGMLLTEPNTAWLAGSGVEVFGGTR